MENVFNVNWYNSQSAYFPYNLVRSPGVWNMISNSVTQMSFCASYNTLDQKSHDENNAKLNLLGVNPVKLWGLGWFKCTFPKSPKVATQEVTPSGKISRKTITNSVVSYLQRKRIITISNKVKKMWNTT